MHRHASSVVLTLVTVATFARSSGAQDAGATTRPPMSASDSVFNRARRLVSEGDGTSGRALVDSMLRAAPEGTPAYGNALYWRGALAETAADAERDYRRVIVEYALSPYADDALLALAELEQARGDRAAAYQHLQRFVREHPTGPARARAGLAAARLAFEQRDVARGCAMIADARASAGSTEVELLNQIDYQGSRCAATASASATATSPSSTVPPSVRSSGSPLSASTSAPRASSAESTTRPAPASATRSAEAPARADTTASRAAKTTTPRSAPATSATATKEPVAKESPAKESPAKESAARASASRGIWTIQLAAYNTRADAEALVRKLGARGVKARISGDKKPFRVRLDYYETRQAAAARVAELKQNGIIGFVTDEPRTSGDSPR